MFRELMSFSYQRTALQAFGWYLIFLIMGFILGAIVGALLAAGRAPVVQTFNGAFLIGQIIIIPYHVILAVALLWSRRKSALNVLLAIVGVLLSALLGALGGLIPLAVLTTRPSYRSRKEIGEVFE